MLSLHLPSLMKHFCWYLHCSIIRKISIAKDRPLNTKLVPQMHSQHQRNGYPSNQLIATNTILRTMPNSIICNWRRKLVTSVLMTKARSSTNKEKVHVGDVSHLINHLSNMRSPIKGRPSFKQTNSFWEKQYSLTGFLFFEFAT